MSNEYHHDMDRWNKAMDDIAEVFLKAKIDPAEGILILAKCIGHTLHEMPDPKQREQLLVNLTSVIRTIMNGPDAGYRSKFVWH